jgi:hypothetical protein
MTFTLTLNTLLTGVVRTTQAQWSDPKVACFGLTSDILRQAAYQYSVLKATPSDRAALKTLAQNSSDPDQQRLAAILTVFETLGATNQQKFITSFVRFTALTVGGLYLIKNPAITNSNLAGKMNSVIAQLKANAGA